MKNEIVCSMVAAFLLLGPLTAFSAEDQIVETTENASMELSGKVVSLDRENQQVIVEYQLEGREAVTSAVFYLSATAEISKSGEAVSVFDLKEGDKVSVTYQINDEDKKVISKLTLTSQ